MTVRFEDMMRAWQDQPARISGTVIQAAAKKARRRATWLTYRDMVMLLVASAMLLITIFRQPNLQNVAIGVLALGLMLWPTWRRYKIAQLTAAIGDRDCDILPGLVRVAKAELAYRTFLMAAAAPMVLIGWTVKLSTRVDGDYSRLFEALALTHPVRLVWVPSVAIFMAWLTFRGRNKARAELRHLQDLQAEYEQEDLLDRER